MDKTQSTVFFSNVRGQTQGPVHARELLYTTELRPSLLNVIGM